MRREIARRLLGLLRPLAPLMAVSASARVINQGLGVLIPALAAALVVGFVTSSGIGGLVALLVVLALLKGTFRYIEQFTGHAVAFRLLSELRVDTYRSIVPLAPAGLEQDRTGDLVARVVGDIDRVEPFYAHTIAPLASAILVPLLTTVGLAIWVDPLVGAVFLPFPVLLAFIIPWISARRVATVAAEARDLAGATGAVFTDSVQGAREVAIFGATAHVAERIDAESRRLADVRAALSRIAALRSGLSDLVSGLAVVAVTLVASGLFRDGDVVLPAVAAAVVAAWVGTGPARVLESIVPDLEQALAAAGRLFELVDREPPLIETVESDVTPRSGGVSFREVTLTLAGAPRRTLDGVSFDIVDGGYAAVVGPSGSGKSTLVELLARFRDPDEGIVSVGGAAVSDLNTATLCDRVALVPQRPEIFFGTIGDNLRLASSEATDAELWAALDQAALGDWVRSLERGIDTPTAELGESMSGGQRQRLAIARAFLRSPDVLILDEATSELDPHTESAVLEEVKRRRGLGTTLIVAHRLESVMDADEIVVLDRGRLVERGTHEDLVAGGGVYAGLWQRHVDVMFDGPA